MDDDPSSFGSAPLSFAAVFETEPPPLTSEQELVSEDVPYSKSGFDNFGDFTSFATASEDSWARFSPPPLNSPDGTKYFFENSGRKQSFENPSEKHSGESQSGCFSKRDSLTAGTGEFTEFADFTSSEDFSTLKVASSNVNSETRINNVDNVVSATPLHVVSDNNQPLPSDDIINNINGENCEEDDKNINNSSESSFHLKNVEADYVDRNGCVEKKCSKINELDNQNFIKNQENHRSVDHATSLKIDSKCIDNRNTLSNDVLDADMSNVTVSKVNIVETQRNLCENYDEVSDSNTTLSSGGKILQKKVIIIDKDSSSNTEEDSDSRSWVINSSAEFLLNNTTDEEVDSKDNVIDDSSACDFNEMKATKNEMEPIEDSNHCNANTDVGDAQMKNPSKQNGEIENSENALEVERIGGSDSRFANVSTKEGDINAGDGCVYENPSESFIDDVQSISDQAILPSDDIRVQPNSDDKVLKEEESTSTKAAEMREQPSESCKFDTFTTIHPPTKNDDSDGEFADFSTGNFGNFTNFDDNVGVTVNSNWQTTTSGKESLGSSNEALVDSPADTNPENTNNKKFSDDEKESHGTDSSKDESNMELGSSSSNSFLGSESSYVGYKHIGDENSTCGDFGDFTNFENENEAESSPTDFGNFSNFESFRSETEDAVPEKFESRQGDEGELVESSEKSAQFSASDNNFGDFGSFDSGVTAFTQAAEKAGLASFESPDSKDLPSSAPPDDNFGDFGSFDSGVTAVNHPAEKPSESVTSESADIEGFASFSAPPDEDFGDFGSFDSGVTAVNHPAEKPSASTSESQNVKDFASFSEPSKDEFGGFGDFDSGVTVVNQPAEKPSSSVSSESQNVKDFASFSEPSKDEFGDFGDFDSGVTVVNQPAEKPSSSTSSESPKVEDFASFSTPPKDGSAISQPEKDEGKQISKLVDIINYCFPYVETDEKNAPKRIYELADYLNSTVRPEGDLSLWQELNMFDEDDNKFSLMYFGSSFFQNQIQGCVKLEYKPPKMKLSKKFGRGTPSLSPSHSLGSLDMEIGPILTPEPAVLLPSKNTLLAQSLTKSMQERDGSAGFHLKKDSGSETTSETASLDLDYFISSSQPVSQANGDQETMKGVNLLDIDFGKNATMDLRGTRTYDNARNADTSSVGSSQYADTESVSSFDSTVLPKVSAATEVRQGVGNESDELENTVVLDISMTNSSVTDEEASFVRHSGSAPLSAVSGRKHDFPHFNSSSLAEGPENVFSSSNSNWINLSKASSGNDSATSTAFLETSSIISSGNVMATFPGGNGTNVSDFVSLASNKDVDNISNFASNENYFPFNDISRLPPPISSDSTAETENEFANFVTLPTDSPVTQQNDTFANFQSSGNSSSVVVSADNFARFSSNFDDTSFGPSGDNFASFADNKPPSSVLKPGLSRSSSRGDASSATDTGISIGSKANEACNIHANSTGVTDLGTIPADDFGTFAGNFDHSLPSNSNNGFPNSGENIVDASALHSGKDFTAFATPNDDSSVFSSKDEFSAFTAATDISPVVNSNNGFSSFAFTTNNPPISNPKDDFAAFAFSTDNSSVLTSNNDNAAFISNANGSSDANSNDKLSNLTSHIDISSDNSLPSNAKFASFDNTTVSNSKDDALNFTANFDNSAIIHSNDNFACFNNVDTPALNSKDDFSSFTTISDNSTLLNSQHSFPTLSNSAVLSSNTLTSNADDSSSLKFKNYAANLTVYPGSSSPTSTDDFSKFPVNFDNSSALNSQVEFANFMTSVNSSSALSSDGKSDIADFHRDSDLAMFNAFQDTKSEVVSSKDGETFTNFESFKSPVVKRTYSGSSSISLEDKMKDLHVDKRGTATPNLIDGLTYHGSDTFNTLSSGDFNHSISFDGLAEVGESTHMRNNGDPSKILTNERGIKPTDSPMISIPPPPSSSKISPKQRRGSRISKSSPKPEFDDFLRSEETLDQTNQSHQVGTSYGPTHDFVPSVESIHNSGGDTLDKSTDNFIDQFSPSKEEFGDFASFETPLAPLSSFPSSADFHGATVLNSNPPLSQSILSGNILKPISAGSNFAAFSDLDNLTAEDNSKNGCEVENSEKKAFDKYNAFSHAQSDEWENLHDQLSASNEFKSAERKQCYRQLSNTSVEVDSCSSVSEFQFQFDKKRDFSEFTAFSEHLEDSLTKEETAFGSFSSTYSNVSSMSELPRSGSINRKSSLNSIKVLPDAHPTSFENSLGSTSLHVVSAAVPPSSDLFSNASFSSAQISDFSPFATNQNLSDVEKISPFSSTLPMPITNAVSTNNQTSTQPKAVIGANFAMFNSTCDKTNQFELPKSRETVTELPVNGNSEFSDFLSFPGDESCRSKTSSDSTEFGDFNAFQGDFRTVAGPGFQIEGSQSAHCLPVSQPSISGVDWTMGNQPNQFQTQNSLSAQSFDQPVMQSHNRNTAGNFAQQSFHSQTNYPLANNVDQQLVLSNNHNSVGVIDIRQHPSHSTPIAANHHNQFPVHQNSDDPTVKNRRQSLQFRNDPNFANSSGMLQYQTHNYNSMGVTGQQSAQFQQNNNLGTNYSGPQIQQPQYNYMATNNSERQPFHPQNSSINNMGQYARAQMPPQHRFPSHPGHQMDPRMQGARTSSYRSQEKDPFADFTIRSNAQQLSIDLSKRTLSNSSKPKLNQILTKSASSARDSNVTKN